MRNLFFGLKAYQGCSNTGCEVVACTVTQIPNNACRKFPAAMSGDLGRHSKGALTRLMRINNPIWRVRSEMQTRRQPNLEDLLKAKFD